jgi:hypothetical protein
MRVEVNVLESGAEPAVSVQHQPALMMALRTGSIEVGSRRSEMMRFTFGAGEMCLVPRHAETWLRTDDFHYLYLSVDISDTTLAAACDGTRGDVELRRVGKLVDARVGALAATVNAERVAGFPAVSGFHRAGARRRAGQRLCSAAPFHADAPRRARFRSLAQDQRVRGRQDRRRVDALRDGASGRVEHSSFLADVSQVNR